MSLVTAYYHFMAHEALICQFEASQASSVDDIAQFNKIVREDQGRRVITIDTTRKDSWRITKTGAVWTPQSAGTVEFSAEEIATDSILQFFGYTHLPERLQPRSQPFAALARCIITTIPRNAERTVALRKLLEAKDAAVRAAV